MISEMAGSEGQIGEDPVRVVFHFKGIEGGPEDAMLLILSVPNKPGALSKKDG